MVFLHDRCAAESDDALPRGQAGATLRRIRSDLCEASCAVRGLAGATGPDRLSTSAEDWAAVLGGVIPPVGRLAGYLPPVWAGRAPADAGGPLAGGPQGGTPGTFTLAGYLEPSAGSEDADPHGDGTYTAAGYLGTRRPGADGQDPAVGAGSARPGAFRGAPSDAAGDIAAVATLVAHSSVGIVAGLEPYTPLGERSLASARDAASRLGGLWAFLDARGRGRRAGTRRPDGLEQALLQECLSLAEAAARALRAAAEDVSRRRGGDA